MGHEEASIVEFMSGNPDAAFARREIARRAVKRRVYEENPRWADQALDSLVARDVLEIDKTGLYSFKKKY